MILQALASEYDRLVERGVLAQPGWQPALVSFGLLLNDDGTVRQVMPLLVPTMRGKKEVLGPQKINVPAQVKRTVGIAANFLCDNSSYILGVDAKGKPQRALECFAACRARHIELLKNCDHPAARAVMRFFETWQPTDADTVLAEQRDEVLAGGNLVFLYGDVYVQNIPAVQAVWNAAYAAGGDGEVMQCLVTGERGMIAKLHPSIKGVVGAQSSGASLVSFNASAFESFGRDGGQGSNAPVSERAAFAYGAALNYLIADGKHHMRLGDMTVVFWAEDAEPIYAQLFAGMWAGADSESDEPDLFSMTEDETVSDNDLRLVMEKLANGLDASWDDIPLHPQNRFYVLGLSPNAARLSVRFFLCDTFGKFADRMRAHQNRLRIVRPAYEKREELSVWQLLGETVNQNARDKSPSPLLAGELMRAILNNAPYPALLFNQVELRIRADRTVSWRRAAIIKAYLLNNMRDSANFTQYKEVLDVELNEQTTYLPYVLGRLFAVLEGIQQAANPDINATIRDRYFSSAGATPALVFPQLLNLAQAHLKKLDTGKRIYHDKQLVSLTGMIHETYPRQMNLYDQGVFQIGYYHQTQKRYEKKEDKSNG